MRLTAKQVQNARPGAKQQKLFDGGGLYLLVHPGGGKYWRYKYRVNGREKTLALGVYPDVSLAAARDRHREARKKLSDGIDPGAQRQAQKAARVADAANTFEAVAREWFSSRAPNWAPSHSSKIIRRLERDLFPWLGARPIAEIKAPELLQVLRRIEGRGALETAHRALQNSGQVFRYAVATGRAERDPSGDLRGALAPWKPVHYASVTNPSEVGELLRAMDQVSGGPIVKAALRLAPLLFVRPGELRQAEWEEIDLDKQEWNIPAERMKTREPHLVPLSKQAVAILRDLYPLTGQGRYVFPSARGGRAPMSNNAVRLALRRMGYNKDQMSGHGFRAMARTIMDEVLHVRPDYIEHQLGHAVRDPLGRAYNRTKHLPERRKMMQVWADYLDDLRSGQTEK